jgi:hypothetical protein
MQQQLRFINNSNQLNMFWAMIFPKHVELIGIINTPLLLHLVDFLCPIVSEIVLQGVSIAISVFLSSEQCI